MFRQIDFVERSIDAQFNSSIRRSTSRESLHFPAWWMTSFFGERIPAEPWCWPRYQRRVRGSILATPRPLLGNPARIYSSLPSALARKGANKNDLKTRQTQDLRLTTQRFEIRSSLCTENKYRLAPNIKEESELKNDSSVSSNRDSRAQIYFLLYRENLQSARPQGKEET